MTWIVEYDSARPKRSNFEFLVPFIADVFQPWARICKKAAGEMRTLLLDAEDHEKIDSEGTFDEIHNPRVITHVCTYKVTVWNIMMIWKSF